MSSNGDALLGLLLLPNNPNMAESMSDLSVWSSDLDMNSSKPSEDFVWSGPPKCAPVVTPSTSLDDTQGPSSMGSEAFDEYALRLPSEPLSCSYLLVETSNGPSEFFYYRFRREPFT